MAQKNELSVLIITHKFREVVAFADDVTILRRGKLVGSDKVKNLTPEQMAEMMVGAEPPSQSSSREDRALGADGLELVHLEADDDLGLPVLEGVSLTVAAGEIVGIAGVSGNGQDELVEVLAGQRPSTGGKVRVGGNDYASTRDQIRLRKVRVLPEAPLRKCLRGRHVLGAQHRVQGLRPEAVRHGRLGPPCERVPQARRASHRAFSDPHAGTALAYRSAVRWERAARRARA